MKWLWTTTKTKLVMTRPMKCCWQWWMLT